MIWQPLNRLRLWWYVIVVMNRPTPTRFLTNSQFCTKTCIKRFADKTLPMKWGNNNFMAKYLDVDNGRCIELQKPQESFENDCVAARCHLSLHAYNQSHFARGLSIDSHAYIISQHTRWPIRTARSTCANQDAWVVITPKRPKANSIHTAACHAWTRTPPLNFVLKLYFP